jgi:hypothetical protein
MIQGHSTLELQLGFAMNIVGFQIGGALVIMEVSRSSRSEAVKESLRKAEIEVPFPCCTSKTNTLSIDLIASHMMKNDMIALMHKLISV